MRAAVTAAPERPAGLPPAASALRVVSSRDLLDGARKVLIEHDGEVYTLQVTRQNKLLLTK